LEQEQEEQAVQKAEALRQLLASDNPIKSVLLKNPEKFAKLLNTTLNNLPNDDGGTLQMIDSMEDSLVGTEIYNIPLHEAFFRKKTEILEVEIMKLLNVELGGGYEALKNLGQNGLWRILIDGKSKILIDGKLRTKVITDKHFFDRSRGYMAGMLRALRKIVEDREKLTYDYLVSLHDLAVDNVTQEGLPNSNFVVEENVDQGSLIVEEKHLLEKGIVANTKHKQIKWGIKPDASDDAVKEIKDLVKEINDEAKINYIEKAPENYWKIGIGDKHSSYVKLLIEWSINKYYNEIINLNQQPDSKDIFGLIIDCCRRLSLIHPFPDANGRVMNFLVLNKLLMDQGFKPTRLNNQIDMVSMTKDVLVRHILEAQ
jgi:hypothetical protein